MSSHLDGAVVVGVAESVFKGSALRWAAEQARLEGRPLTLANASGPVSGASRDYGIDEGRGTSQALQLHGAQLLSRARAVVERAVPGLQVNQLFDVTDPRTLLVQLSSTAHLLVLGSRGRGTVRSHLLGSVGLAVVRHTSCPVLVHRPGSHPGLVHRGVVVAADATEESIPVLEFAFRQASLRRLPLKVVHFVYDVRSALVPTPIVRNLGEDTEEHARVLAESVAGYREEYPDVHLTVEMFPGLLPEQGLIKLSREADLTIVGTHQRSILGRALAGSVSTTVVEHATGPVAVVPTALR